MWTVNCHWVAFVSLSDNHILTLYTCPLFSVKCGRLFALAEPEFLKIYQRLPKIAEDFKRLLKIAEGFQRLPKIFRQLPMITKGVERFSMTSKQGQHDFQRISNQSRALLKSSEDVLMTSWTSEINWILFNRFLSNYTRYYQLGVRN